MKEKILILANYDVGLYRFRKELISELIHRNYEVSISLPEGDLIKNLKDLGCKYYETEVDRRGLNPLIDLKLIKRYFQIIKECKPSLIITYTIKPNIYGGLACRLLKVPYAVNITGLGTAFQKEGLLKKFVVFLYKLACKKAKVLFFENEENRQIFLKEKIVREEQTCLLMGAGVNIEEYQYTEYPGKNTPTRFLFIGRVMKEKGVDELFEAAKRIKKEYPEVKFDIVGPFEDDYGKVIAELDSEGVICYHGFQNDVKPFIAQSHCFVLPSWHEGMANTNLESAAMGRPLITSRIHGCMEAVIEGMSGFLCEKQNVESLYEAMKNFVELSHEERENMGRAGRRHMKDVFDKKKVVEKTVERLLE